MSFTIHMSLESRMQTIKAILLEDDTDLARFYRESLLDLDKLRIDRNSVVHNLWLGENALPHVTGVKHTNRGEIKSHRTEWSEADIEGLASDIESWIIDVVNAMTS